MADSSYEKGLLELTKMKVADLRAELKQRNLSTAGNKTELMERLQLAIHGDSTLSIDETAEEILDEEILGDEEIEELASKPDSQESSEKRKLSTDSNGSNTSNTSNISNLNGTTNGKKVVLNRKSVIEDIKINEEPKKDTEIPKTTDDAVPEKKVIKLSELSMQERLEMRKRKFGAPTTDTAKKVARAARFNLDNTKSSSASSISTPVNTSYEVLKKREERFGSSVSTVMEKAELQARIEKRKARFGEVKPVEKVFPNKIKIVK
ncbi:SAP domain-containing ribonucleoprotein isoform X2 [Belonocnema kinseyi]|uniref:SAP domain-containing ribonucleoprotein isoform X2 n=1 Tax=Belonocnema kinseyi TaxID=2817044 RepID=UPI00143D510E|nr:SAP domain-containing ribonucleoprotein isoform X2 [Belonocnema kinseyi]